MPRSTTTRDRATVEPRPSPCLLALATLASLAAACASPSDTQGPALSSSAPNAAAQSSNAIGDPAAPTSSAESDRADDAAEQALGSEAAPLVDLAGVHHPPPPIADGAPRVAARAMLVPIHARPDASARTIGFLRAGAIVETTPEVAGKAGCPGGWKRLVPTGFACLGDKLTENLDDPIVRATARRPDASQSLPYMYGTVTRGGPVYAKLPTDDELRAHEPNLTKHFRKWKEDEVSGASYGHELWFKWRTPPSYTAWEAHEERLTDTEIPFYLRDGGRVPNLSGLVKEPSIVKIDQVDRRQGAAFLESFLWEGRRYNVTTDLRVAPADRYRPIRGSTHHGVQLGVEKQLPLVLIRKAGGKRWLWQASKKAMIADGELEYRGAHELTGKQQFFRGVLHFETKDGFWVDDRHASRLDPAKRMPKWGKNGEKWLDVNITKQTLVAYEGERPVYATLVSTGEDGLAEGGRATKKGIFRVHTKYVATTMDSTAVGEEFELRDVPYVQYFEEGFALHGAYWHDSFGTPKSHGCINLTPEDARRLFYWTDPPVPSRWHGSQKSLTGTVLFIHP